MIALGYHDGPTTGLLQCAQCNQVYEFEEVKRWGDEWELFLYALAPLPLTALGDVTEVLAPYQTPKWPIWCPPWQFPSEEARACADRQVEQILEQAGSTEWVLASYDLLGEILVAQRIQKLSDGTTQEIAVRQAVNDIKHKLSVATLVGDRLCFPSPSHPSSGK